jgi:hypothetical protein
MINEQYWKMYSLEYTYTSKVFFTPYQASHCCTVIHHCWVTMCSSNVNDVIVGQHCFPTMTSFTLSRKCFPRIVSRVPLLRNIYPGYAVCLPSRKSARDWQTIVWTHKVFFTYVRAWRASNNYYNQLETTRKDAITAVPAFLCRDWEKSRITSVRIDGRRTAIWTRDLRTRISSASHNTKCV